MRNWRDYVARAAAAEVGRVKDNKTIWQARQVVDLWLSVTKLALGILVVLGAISGWQAMSVLLRPADGQVHAEWALMVIVATPWAALALRIVLILLNSGSLLFDRLVPILLSPQRWLLWVRNQFPSMSRPRGAEPWELFTATTNAIGGMLVDKGDKSGGAGRPLSALGHGVFWTAYAMASCATIWIVNSHVALGFGFGWTWESSTFSPRFRLYVAEFVRAAVEFPAPVLACIGSDGLMPVAPVPVAPDDAETFAVRRSWVCALTAGVGAYLLVPMVLWTLYSFVRAYSKITGWKPDGNSEQSSAESLSAATGTRLRREPAPTPSRPPPAGGGVCTHVVRLEPPEEAVALPAPLDGLYDLGHVDEDADLERVQGELERFRGMTHAGPARIAVVGWLPVSPDRRIKRWLSDLANSSTAAPLLVLDGYHRLRGDNPADNAQPRLDYWHKFASEAGLESFECDLAKLTDSGRRDLVRVTGLGDGSDRRREPTTESGSGPTLR